MALKTAETHKSPLRDSWKMYTVTQGWPSALRRVRACSDRAAWQETHTKVGRQHCAGSELALIARPGKRPTRSHVLRGT